MLMVMISTFRLSMIYMMVVALSMIATLRLSMI